MLLIRARAPTAHVVSRLAKYVCWISQPDRMCSVLSSPSGGVYAAGRPLKPLVPVDPDVNNKVDPTISYGFFGILSEKAVNRSLHETKIYTPLALPLLNQARTGCLWDLESDVTIPGLTRANTYVNGRNSGLSDEVVGDVGHKFATLKLAAPLFIGAGLDPVRAQGDQR